MNLRLLFCQPSIAFGKHMTGMAKRNPILGIKHQVGAHRDGNLVMDVESELMRKAAPLAGVIVALANGVAPMEIGSLQSGRGDTALPVGIIQPASGYRKFLAPLLRSVLSYVGHFGADFRRSFLASIRGRDLGDVLRAFLYPLASYRSLRLNLGIQEVVPWDKSRRSGPMKVFRRNRSAASTLANLGRRNRTWRSDSVATAEFTRHSLNAAGPSASFVWNLCRPAATTRAERNGWGRKIVLSHELTAPSVSVVRGRGNVSSVLRPRLFYPINAVQS